MDFGFTTAAYVDGGDFGSVEEAVGYDVVDLAGGGGSARRGTRARWVAWSPVRAAVVGVQEVGDEAAAGHLLVLDGKDCCSSEVIWLVSVRATDCWPGLGMRTVSGPWW